MKITIISFLAALLSINSINAYSQTTVEEYNYLTKGYKIQIESGLDTKSGYSLESLGTFYTVTHNRHCEFKALIRKNSKTLAAVLAIFHASNGATYYFCIPKLGSSEEIFNAYRNSLNAFDNMEDSFSRSLDAAKDYAVFESKLFDLLFAYNEKNKK